MAKTFFDEIDVAEQATSPTTPPSGFQRMYPKTDGKWYAKNSSGIEREITNTIGGGGGLSFQEIMRLKTIMNNI